VDETSSPQTFPRQLIWLLVALSFGWGLNWPIMKVVIREMAPMHFRTMCLVGGAAGLFGVAWASGLPIRVPAGQWPRLIATGLVNMVGWNVFAIYGVSLMASGRAAILGYTMPAWGVLLSAWLLGEPLTRRRLCGMGLGMAGMLVLMGSELSAVGRSPLGALCMITAAITWALATVMLKRWPVDLPTTSLTAWQMAIGLGPILGVALAVEAGPFHPFGLSFWPMLGALYNIVVAFIFSYWAWTKIALQAPVGVSSLAVMMVPVIGVFSSALVFREMPRWPDYLALLLVVGSLATVMLPPRSPAPSR
jgi:drug/metabolite transporter (DMT)-like permease